MERGDQESEAHRHLARRVEEAHSAQGTRKRELLAEVESLAEALLEGLP